MLLLFALWVILNGKLNVEIALFGVVLSGALYAFCHAFLGYSLKKELKILRMLPGILGYARLLVKEIVKSNLAVMRIVYSKRVMEVKPQLVTFTTQLEGPFRVLLANSITITPGTITVHCENDTLTVHCLDASFAEGIEHTEFEQRLLKLQEEARA